VNGHVVGRRTVNGLTLVTLAGELDVVAVRHLRHGLRATHLATLPDLAVDLRAVTFLDCAAVGVLIAARNQVTLAGGCLRVAGLQTEPRRLLALCHLDDVVCVHESLAEATAVRCAFHEAMPETRGPAPHRSVRY
jgi:anti-sigma B factor antagonist